MSSSEEGKVVEFVPLLNFENDYEILNVYPFTLRKKANKRVLSESLDNGYVQVHLNGKHYRKHRLIALQFLPNDDPINNDVIDLINHDKTDNHLHNIRWCSSTDYNRNKTVYNRIQAIYTDDIPDDVIVVDFYDTKTERRAFDENKYYYYHDEDVFYAKITDDIYKILHHNIAKSGNEYVNMKDVNNKLVSVMINRFKQQHDLI